MSDGMSDSDNSDGVTFIGKLSFPGDDEDLHQDRMNRIRNLTSFEDVTKEASDAVEAVLDNFTGLSATTATYVRARSDIHAALMTRGFDCPFRIESNYVGGGVNNPRVIFLNRATVRVLKNLATNCPNDFDSWKPLLTHYACEL